MLRKFVLILLLFSAFSAHGQDEKSRLIDKLGEESNADTLIGVLLSLGQIYANEKIDSSIFYLERAYQLSTALGRSSDHYKVTNALGIVYQDIDNSKAAEYAYECLEEVETLENSQELLPVIYINLGSIHRKNQEFEKARDFYFKSLDLMEAKGDSLGMAECYNNIGTAYMMDDEVYDGVYYWEKSLVLKENMGADYSAANSMINLAIYYKDTEQTDEAFDFSFRALTIYEKYEDWNMVANTHVNIGDTWTKLKNWKKAVQHYEKALNYLGDHKPNFDKIPALKGLWVAYYEDGQTKKARKALERWQFLTTGLEKEEAKRLTIELGTKYEVDKNEKEIALLKKENEIKEIQQSKDQEEIKRKDLQFNLLMVSIAFLLCLMGLLLYISIQRRKAAVKLKLQKDLVQEKSRALESSLGQKEVLLKEVHHRVKNNLEIISSLIELQSASIKDEDTAQVISSWQNRINSIALIHHDLYQFDNDTSVRLNEYLDHLVSNIRTVHSGQKKVQLKLEVNNNLTLDVDKAVSIGLIVNELISNCFKHAFKERNEGEISLNVFESPKGSIEVVVQDNGVGIDMDKKEGSSDSLGLRLVHILVRQLKANLQWENEQGSKAIIRFKK